MIDANKSVFQDLENFCRLRGQHLPNPGAVRYIRTNSEEKQILKNLRVKKRYVFGFHRAAVYMEFEDAEFIATIGYEFDVDEDELVEGSINAGFITAILSELRPRPNVPADEVSNIVGASSGLDGDYKGHSSDAVMELFPRIQLFSLGDILDEESVDQLLLRMSASECLMGGAWINEELSDNLREFSRQRLPRMPYRHICRAIFDLDPRSLYMALYRCIEAMYAYDACRRLGHHLSLSREWYEIAEVLYDQLSWRPSEGSSLSALLNYADVNDLSDVCAQLGVEVGNHLPGSAGSAIYQLRNQIVHYRPGIKKFDESDIDWNAMCGSILRIVESVHRQAHLNSFHGI